MKRLALFLAALAIGLVAPTIAAPPDHAGGPGGNPAAPGQAGAPSPDAPAPVTPVEPAKEPPGHAKKADPPGQSKNDDSPGKAKKEASAPSRPVPADQDAAQDAVDSDEALPLAKIISIAEARTSGRVINARMVRISGVLLYQLTLLDDGGRSWRNYYLAKSGNPVVLR